MSCPGARINFFETVDDRTILHNGETNTKAHFYVSVGICDITQKLGDNNYEEVIFSSQNFINNKTNLYREFDRLDSAIKNQYAVPVFCTILPMNLQAWNMHRLATNKTCRLLHTNNYAQMQQELEREVVELNNYLTSLNIANGMSTPMMHKDIEHNRGRGRKVLCYQNLRDGCHPNRTFFLKLKKTIMVAYSKNKNMHRH